MAVLPAEFATGLLKEAQETHPWLHHPLFRMIYDGQLTRVQLQSVIRQQGCFFLDTLRHAAWKIISVGGKTTAHAFLFITLAEALGISRDELFATEYLPTTIIETNELFLLQRTSTAGSTVWREHHDRVDQRDPRAADGRREPGWSPATAHQRARAAWSSRPLRHAPRRPLARGSASPGRGSST